VRSAELAALVQPVEPGTGTQPAGPATGTEPAEAATGTQPGEAAPGIQPGKPAVEAQPVEPAAQLQSDDSATRVQPVGPATRGQKAAEHATDTRFAPPTELAEGAGTATDPRPEESRARSQAAGPATRVREVATPPVPQAGQAAGGIAAARGVRRPAPTGPGVRGRGVRRPALLLAAASVAVVVLAATAVVLASPDDPAGSANGQGSAGGTLAPATSNGGATPTTSAPTTTVELPSGTSELLLADDFSNTSNRWSSGKQAAGTVSYADGAYTFHAEKVSQVMQGWPTNVEVTERSVRLDVSAKRLGGALNAGFGVFCRWNPDTDSLYKLEIQDDGAFTIHKRLRGNWTKEPLALGQNPAVIKRGQVHQVQAVCSSGGDGEPVTLSLSVNGRLLKRVVDREDTLPPAGFVGLLATTYLDTEVPFDVAFDDFAAYAL
jgi:hypothetical protein